MVDYRVLFKHTGVVDYGNSNIFVCANLNRRSDRGVCFSYPNMLPSFLGLSSVPTVFIGWYRFVVGIAK